MEGTAAPLYEIVIETISIDYLQRLGGFSAGDGAYTGRS